MSLERKDVRVKLDSDWHQMLAAVADADRADIGEWVELLVVSELQRRIHAANVISAAAARAGISGKTGE